MTKTKSLQAREYAEKKIPELLLTIEKAPWPKTREILAKAYTDGCAAAEQSMTDSEATVIQGWVAIDEAYGEAFLHEKKPILKNQPIADTGDYNCVWHSDSKTYLLDAGLFPDMDCESEPREVEITIKPKKR
ncbi:hypothetical protein [Muribaculum intestinale]|uniref:hypothetical protein n=1 Tax=Muribaculum intestinale TaxID=1796646 RepID=UPI0025B747A3|nr:hypothetical protein [Muribaculum intestinale]